MEEANLTSFGEDVDENLPAITKSGELLSLYNPEKNSLENYQAYVLFQDTHSTTDFLTPNLPQNNVGL